LKKKEKKILKSEKEKRNKLLEIVIVVINTFFLLTVIAFGVSAFIALGNLMNGVGDVIGTIKYATYTLCSFMVFSLSTKLISN
jgi:hypothetical protein